MIKHILFASLMVIGSQLVASGAEPNWVNISRKTGKDKKKGPWIAYSGTSGTLVSTIVFHKKTKLYRGAIKDTRTGEEVEPCPTKRAESLYEKFQAYHNPEKDKQSPGTSDMSDIE